jgi:Rieske 2Fe-2S family protein
LLPTLGSVDYCSDEVFELDRTRVFHAGWVFVCHIEAIAPGHKRVFDVAGESVIVTRDLLGDVRAFANVCRHRGAELCDASTSSKGSIRCAYHAWTYGLDGTLLATPRVDDDFDRGDYGLWPHHADVWNGMVFVSVADAPTTLAEWIATENPDLTLFDHLPVGDYRIGARSEKLIAANWKIVIENYQECLHCAVVHPELASVIPLYKTGNVVDPEREDGAVDLAPGATALTPTGTTQLTRLPGVGEAPEYDGAMVFPNLFFDLSPTNLALTAIFPLGPDRTFVVSEYLYAAADVEREDFEPGGEFELNEIVAGQDATVCEMVQRGVSSKAFTTGGLTAKDEAVADFIRQYLDMRGPVGTE